MVNTSTKAKPKGKGKQPKKFLEQKVRVCRPAKQAFTHALKLQDTALQLASIIADQQETKAKEKVEKHHRQDKVRAPSLTECDQTCTN